MPGLFNDKATARSRFVNDRSTLGNQVLRAASADAVHRLLEAPEVVTASRLCAYISFGTEPETAGLVEALSARGSRVLLPVLLPDGDLDWALDDGHFATGRRSLREPVSPRLGPAAVQDVDVIVVPALAISSTGQRLGRGGGSYDRALARVARPDAGTTSRRRPWICALVYDHEIGADFPIGSHDQPVDAACTPGRLVRFTG